MNGSCTSPASLNTRLQVSCAVCALSNPLRPGQWPHSLIKIDGAVAVLVILQGQQAQGQPQQQQQK